jgi:hypothetical protein
VLLPVEDSDHEKSHLPRMLGAVKMEGEKVWEPCAKGHEGHGGRRSGQVQERQEVVVQDKMRNGWQRG